MVNDGPDDAHGGLLVEGPKVSTVPRSLRSVFDADVSDRMRRRLKLEWLRRFGRRRGAGAG